jgi:hypothetical protein
MDERVQAYARARGLRPQTIERWLGWDPAASAALCRLAVALKIGENHLRDLMDWLEEIALRDGRAIDAILAEKFISGIETDPRLGRADKLKRIKDAIRRRRFPRLACAEDAIRAQIIELKLQPEIILSASPGLEGGRLRVEFSASSQEELKKIVARLADAADNARVNEVFALLANAGLTSTDD